MAWCCGVKVGCVYVCVCGGGGEGGASSVWSDDDLSPICLGDCRPVMPIPALPSHTKLYPTPHFFQQQQQRQQGMFTAPFLSVQPVRFGNYL